MVYELKYPTVSNKMPKFSATAKQEVQLEHTLKMIQCPIPYSCVILRLFVM